MKAIRATPAKTTAISENIGLRTSTPANRKRIMGSIGLKRG